MTRGFAPWETADEMFKLSSTDNRGHARYPVAREPGATPAVRYRPAAGLLEQLEALLSEEGVALLRGRAGSGKTFHALLMAMRWADPRRSARLAFYGLARELDAEAVREQWDTELARRHECLWIIDEPLDSPELSRSLIGQFDTGRLLQAGHRILLVSRDRVDRLTGADRIRRSLPSQEIKLASDTAEAALRLSFPRREIPERSVLEEWCKKVGLRQIMQYFDGGQLGLPVPPDARQQYANDYLHGLDEDRVGLARLLAALRFLYLELRDPPATLQASFRDLERAGVGLAAGRTSFDAGRPVTSWTTSNDELAMSIFSTFVTAGDLSGLYVQLGGWCERTPSVMPHVMVRLAEGYMGSLDQWAAGGDGHAAPALAGLLDVMDARRTAAVVAPVQPGMALRAAREADKVRPAGRAVDAVLDVLMPDLRTRLCAAPVRLWVELAAVAGDQTRPELAALLREVVRDEELASTLRRSTRKGEAMVAFVNAVDPELGKLLGRAALPEGAHEFAAALRNAPTSRFWSGLTHASWVEPSYAIESFTAMSQQTIARRMYRRPGLAREFVLSLPNHDRKGVIARLNGLCQAVPVRNEDVQAWGWRDVVHFADLAGWMGQHTLLASEPFPNQAIALIRAAPRSTLVVDLCRALRDRTTPELRIRLLAELRLRVEVAQIDSHSYAHAAAYLDLEEGRALTRIAVRQEAEGLIQGSVAQRFWRLWNGTALLSDDPSSDDAALLRRAAASIAGGWQLPVPATPSDMALAGLLSHVTGEAIQALTTSWTGTREGPSRSIRSVPHAGCALFAVSSAVRAEPDRLAEAGWLASGLVQRDRQFTTNWRSLRQPAPDAQRLAALLYRKAAAALDGVGAGALASAITKEVTLLIRR